MVILLGFAGQYEDYESTIAAWAPIYRDSENVIRLALDVGDPAGLSEQIAEASLTTRGTQIEPAIESPRAMAFVVVGEDFARSIWEAELPPPPWFDALPTATGPIASPMDDARQVASDYLDAIADRSVDRFAEVLSALIGEGDPQSQAYATARSVLDACEGNWRLPDVARLVVRTSYEMAIREPERVQRLLAIGQSRRPPVDLDSLSSEFIGKAVTGQATDLLRWLRSAGARGISSALDGKPKAPGTTPSRDDERSVDRGFPSRVRPVRIVIGDLVGSADPAAIRRDLIEPLELMAKGAPTTLDFADSEGASRAANIWTERSAILSLALLSTGLSPTVHMPAHGRHRRQLDRAGIDLFIEEIGSPSPLSSLQQRLQIESDISGIWRLNEPDDQPPIVGDLMRLAIPNPHSLPADRMEFLQKSVFQWTAIRARDLLQRDQTKDTQRILLSAAEAASELIKNAAEHSKVDIDRNRANHITEEGTPLRSFLEVFFTLGGRQGSGNRLSILALDAGVGIPSTARPKLESSASGQTIIRNVLGGALKGVSPGRGYGLTDVASLVNEYDFGMADSAVPARLFIASGDQEKRLLSIVSQRRGERLISADIPTSIPFGTAVWLQLPLAAQRGQRSRRSRLRAGPHPVLPGLEGVAEQE